MIENLYVYIALGVTLSIYIFHKLRIGKRTIIDNSIVEAMKYIAESMVNGNSFEASIKEIVDKKELECYSFFNKVLVKAQGSDIGNALIEAAKDSKDQTLIYIADTIAVCLRNQGDTVSALKQLSHNLWEINTLERKIDEKISSAITTVQFTGVLIIPLALYFLAGILSSGDMLITVDIYMKVFMGVLALIVSFIEFIIFEDLMESLITLPLVASIFLLNINIVGPLLMSI